MKDRKFLKDTDPQAFDVMLGFEKYLAKSSLKRVHADLIKIRVSQINGCTYCIDKHVQDAIQSGEHPRRLFVLPSWRETPFFTQEERAILAFTEDITLISTAGVSDEVYDQALSVLGQQYLTEVMMAVIAMNAWNRVGITTGREPE